MRLGRSTSASDGWAILRLVVGCRSVSGGSGGFEGLSERGGGEYGVMGELGPEVEWERIERAGDTDGLRALVREWCRCMGDCFLSILNVRRRDGLNERERE